MYAPPADVRNAIVAATSSGEPARRAGTVRANASTTDSPPYCARPSVRMSPHATQTTRIPYCDHSFDRPDARFSSAARADEACTTVGMPRRGLNPTKITTPRRRGIIQRFATSCVRCQGASTFNRWTARNPFSGIVSAGAANCPPALLTRMSTPPNRSPTASRKAPTCSGSRTSQGEREHVVAGGLELGARGVERLGTPPADRDAGAGPRELTRGGAADTGSPAGHDRHRAGVRVGRPAASGSAAPLPSTAVCRRSASRLTGDGGVRLSGRVFGPPSRRCAGLSAPSRTRLQPAHLGPDAAASHAPVPRGDLRRSRSRSERKAGSGLRVRSRRRGRARRDGGRGAPASLRGGPFVGRDGGAGPRRCAIPAPSRGAVLVDGGVVSMRDGIGVDSGPRRRSCLAPPRLAGTPVDAFRAMIPTFLRGKVRGHAPDRRHRDVGDARAPRRHDRSASVPVQPLPHPSRDLATGPRVLTADAPGARARGRRARGSPAGADDPRRRAVARASTAPTRDRPHRRVGPEHPRRTPATPGALASRIERFATGVVG